MDYIGRHKRLQAYDSVDFELLTGVIERFSDVVFTPNVLTETSNLIRHIGEPMRSEIALVLGKIVARAEEKFIVSSVAVAREEYGRLGLTDAVMLELATLGATLLTSDVGLYLAAQKANLKAENFNHVRDLRRDFAI